MIEHFVSEAIHPLPASFEFNGSGPGEPAIPRRFRWRKEIIGIAFVVRKWTSTSSCRHGSGEQYVRRHWYEMATDDGRRMILYFDRQPKSFRHRKKRWWVSRVTEPGPPECWYR